MASRDQLIPIKLVLICKKMMLLNGVIVIYFNKVMGSSGVFLYLQSSVFLLAFYWSIFYSGLLLVERSGIIDFDKSAHYICSIGFMAAMAVLEWFLHNQTKVYLMEFEKYPKERKRNLVIMVTVIQMVIIAVFVWLIKSTN